MAPTVLLLLLLLRFPGCVSGVPAESVYTRVQRFEGETLLVRCPYKGRKKHAEAKVWCKIRRKTCDPGFTRVWAQGPRYLLQDDAQAREVNITMATLRRQDSGRYWCMRNSSGTLYPLMGIQLEVFPVPTAKRNTPFTQLADILKSEIVATTGRTPTSGPDSPFTTSVRTVTPGDLGSAGLLPSTASEATGQSATEGHGFASPSPPGPQTTAAPPSSAGPAPVSTGAGHLRTRSPTVRMCLTSRSLLNKLPPVRHQDSHPILLVSTLSFLSVPVMVVVVYGLWKKRHVGSYSMCRGLARPWRDLLGRPESPWKPAWFKATYGVGELFLEGPQEEDVATTWYVTRLEENRSPDLNSIQTL